MFDNHNGVGGGALPIVDGPWHNFDTMIASKLRTITLDFSPADSHFSSPINFEIVYWSEEGWVRDVYTMGAVGGSVDLAIGAGMSSIWVRSLKQSVLGQPYHIDSSILNLNQAVSKNALLYFIEHIYSKAISPPDYNYSPNQYRNNECFPAGTSIKLASGETVSIEDIAIADQIAAVHNSSQEIVIDARLNSGTVSRLYTNVSEDYVELNFIDPATGKQITLTVTPGHVFLDENGKWRQIGDMIANANEANNVAPFTGSNIGSKIAEATIAPKLNATILSLNTAANDNYPGHVTTNLKTTYRLLRRAGAKCIGGGYVV